MHAVGQHDDRGPALQIDPDRRAGEARVTEAFPLGKALAALGTDFPSLPPDEQDERLRAPANREFVQLLYDHACEGMYGAPAYGGNRDLAGWRSIDFPGDVQPTGYTDEEVANP